jgi:hypothetical protein
MNMIALRHDYVKAFSGATMNISRTCRFLGMYIHLCTHMYIYVHTYVYLCISMYIYVCLWIYIYSYINMYITFSVATKNISRTCRFLGMYIHECICLHAFIDMYI